MKILPVTAELFHADGWTQRQAGRRTDRHDEANNRFSRFFENAKIWIKWVSQVVSLIPPLPKMTTNFGFLI
jgi:hypothetical protein